MNFEGDDIPDYDEMIKALGALGFHRHQLNLKLEFKYYESPPTRPSIAEPLVLELKALPAHMRYVFLGTNNSLPVIVVTYLNDKQVEVLVLILKRLKRAIRWTIIDIIAIPPSICTHKIQLVKDDKPSIKHQRCLNPPI